MKTRTKQILSALVFLSALTGCKIEDPDFFVPEVAFVATEKEVVFDPAGGTESFSVESNCDWSVSCPAEWVTLSVETGDRNGTVEIVVEPTKLPRKTTVTLYSNEVESRTSVISIVQNGVVEISSVSAPIVSDFVSASGTTATLRAIYSGISIAESDAITAGFILTLHSGEGTAVEVPATVDRAAETFRAELTELIQNETYDCVAWARLNDDPKVCGEPASFTPILLPTELKSVGATIVSGQNSETGTTATLESSYVAVSLGSEDVVTAGFTLTSDGGAPFEIPAVVDAENSAFKADATGLVADTDYTCIAWACLNGGERVEGLPTTFRPTESKPVTIVADFSSNALWGLPESNSSMEQKEVSVTDEDGYTWKIFGGCIADGCLWLACQSKKSFNGYVILPQLNDKTVKSISFPNDGKSPSGKARITISVSEDGGSSFTPLPGCIQVACGTFKLSDQKPGSIYKVENVDASGTNGYSKTVKLTIEAE
ncbi:MAG: BACON domain-containing protein [Alistipes senegalensis]|nr:BACON domain-containing protein [Bacteroides cellulosilyticus]MCM1352522.1 BACON domain-containing protein [Alistipes senegalensis]